MEQNIKEISKEFIDKIQELKYIMPKTSGIYMFRGEIDENLNENRNVYSPYITFRIDLFNFETQEDIDEHNLYSPSLSFCPNIDILSSLKKKIII